MWILEKINIIKQKKKKKTKINQKKNQSGGLEIIQRMKENLKINLVVFIKI